MNRFIELDRTLAELERGRARGRREQAPRAASLSLPGRSLAGALTADQRGLVVLIENGGVDLGIPALVDRLLGNVPSFVLSDEKRRELVEALREKLKQVTDNLLEAAELLVNRYEGMAPGLYGEVVILRNSTALYANLRETLVGLTRAGKVIDLLVLTHGGKDAIALGRPEEAVTGRMIRDLRAANGGAPLRLRSVYMMNCEGSSLNKAWLAAGAKVSSGSAGTNYLPEPTTFFFFENWRKGQSFNDAVTNAYLRCIATMKDVLREVARKILPAPLADRIVDDIVNLEARDFVKESRPVIEGEIGVTVGSDDLVFGQWLAAPMAYTVVPLGETADAGAAGKPATFSASAVDFVKGWEGFRANLYDDPAGHCTIGYGTLVHRGRCSGDPSEAPYRAGITEARAEELLRDRLADATRTVITLVKVDLSQQQLDALSCFVYALGAGNFRESTLLRKLNAGGYAAVPVELKRWVYADGKVMEGLVRRRAGEARMFEAGDYSTGKSWSAVA